MYINQNELLRLAREARERSYSPYSNFRVGAAVVDDEGRIHMGSNVENSSYGATICAERVAITKAVSEGAVSISAIAIVSDSLEPVTPCGICRQVISEFADEEALIICGSKNKESNGTVYKLGTLLPDAFKL